MSLTIQNLVNDLNGHFELLSGSPQTLWEGVSPATNPKASSLIFITDLKTIKPNFDYTHSIFIVPLKHKDTPTPNCAAKLASRNPSLAMAKTLEFYFADRPTDFAFWSGVHPTAVISPLSKLGHNVMVGPYSIVGPNVTIDDNTVIGPHCYLEGDITIGANSEIHSHTFIARRTQIGSFTEIKPHCTIGSAGFGFAQDEKGTSHRIQQKGRVIIGSHVSIGAFSAIDRATFEDTKIGDGTKLDNHVHIAHNCSIGKHCLMAGGFMMAGSSHIGDHVVIGGRANIRDHITIASRVQIGGASSISRSINEPGAYAGYPTQPIKDYLKTTASIPSLPRLRKNVSRILKHLNLSEED